MIERWRGRVSEGMVVKTSDGEKLGKIVACQPGGVVVEKGFLFPKDLTIPYERIQEIQGAEVILTWSRAELGEPGGRPATAGVTGAVKKEASEVSEAARAARNAFDEFGKGGEIRVPIVEEEVVASKHVEKVGEVHVRKEIVTEEKQITVPVMREVIRVERVPVNHEARPGDRPFEAVSYDIPIREEHVTVEKHAVVHEELRVGKEIQQGEETTSATVRRERAEVETLGSIRRAEGISREIGQQRQVSASAAAAKR